MALSGHLALITGASGGIGQATCVALAKLGCDIAIHYHSSTQNASMVKEKVDAFGVGSFIFQADLSDYDQVRRLYRDVVKHFGRAPSILFNNAGLTLNKSRVTSISEISIEDFEQTWRANCGSAFLLTQLALPEMEKSGWGRIVFCSSVAGLTGGVVGPHYASSKSAIHGLVHWLASAYAKKGITVNAVAPALIEQTTMLPGATEELKQKVPVGRLGFPEEIANTVVWMVQNGYLTNKVIAVDGGMFPQ